jgi:hypothetical protein
MPEIQTHVVLKKIIVFERENTGNGYICLQINRTFKRHLSPIKSNKKQPPNLPHARRMKPTSCLINPTLSSSGATSDIQK